MAEDVWITVIIMGTILWMTLIIVTYFRWYYTREAENEAEKRRARGY